jgi:hypothetical protein
MPGLDDNNYILAKDDTLAKDANTDNTLVDRNIVSLIEVIQQYSKLSEEVRAAAAVAGEAQAELERAKEVFDTEMAAGMNAPTPTAVEAVQRAMVAYNTAVENSSAANKDLIEKMQEHIDAHNTLTAAERGEAATGVTAAAAMGSSPKKRRNRSNKIHKRSKTEAQALQLPFAPALPPGPPEQELLRYPNGGTNTKKSYRRYKKRKTKHYKKKTKRYTKKRNMYY